MPANSFHILVLGADGVIHNHDNTVSIRNNVTPRKSDSTLNLMLSTVSGSKQHDCQEYDEFV